MSCEKCRDVVERPDLPHVVRECEGCGREMRVHEPGEHGRGLRVRPGERPVIPAGWLNPSLNPLKGSSRFTPQGISWYAELINVDQLPAKRDEMPAEIERLAEQNEAVLRGSPLLEGLSLNDPSHFDQIDTILESTRGTREWWARLSLMFLGMVEGAIEEKDVVNAVWAMGCAERCRSMRIFKEHLEEVVFMGQSAKRVIDILRTWDASQQNSDEAFWQLTFAENVYALSQVFAAPLIFIKDSAYVGGMNVDRKNAKFADYLFAHESSREAVLVEIKTPVTKLLRAKYRGTYRPSAELTGAVMQVLDYRRTLVRDQRSIIEGSGRELHAFSPKCVVVVGNGAAELASQQKRRAFEDFRTNSRDVEIVTYDELFRKIEVLASLFSLTRPAPAKGSGSDAPQDSKAEADHRER